MTLLRLMLSLLAPLLIGPAMAAGPASAIRSVDVVGTSFRVTFADGRIVSGEALQGATLTLTLPGAPGPRRIRLDEIIVAPDDPEILLHRILLLPDRPGAPATELCEADPQGARWAFPLRGQWDARGRRLTDRGLTLACATGGAIGKCARWGYKPWGLAPNGTPRAPYHAACIHMVRADYCGDRGTTRDGMTIDYFDDAGINRPEEARDGDLGLSFEAAWSPQGALCVAHMRVPEHMTLAGLARSCPRLKQRLGPANCVEALAKKAYYGAALLFNRSR